MPKKYIHNTYTPAVKNYRVQFEVPDNLQDLKKFDLHFNYGGFCEITLNSVTIPGTQGALHFTGKRSSDMTYCGGGDFWNRHTRIFDIFNFAKVGADTILMNPNAGGGQISLNLIPFLQLGMNVIDLKIVGQGLLKTSMVINKAACLSFQEVWEEKCLLQ